MSIPGLTGIEGNVDRLRPGGPERARLCFVRSRALLATSGQTCLGVRRPMPFVTRQLQEIRSINLIEHGCGLLPVVAEGWLMPRPWPRVTPSSSVRPIEYERVDRIAEKWSERARHDAAPTKGHRVKERPMTSVPYGLVA